jgi:ribosomal-protein-alanine N-acetyltransferase
MSSVPRSPVPFDVMSGSCFAPMRVEDLNEVQVIEESVYPHPWTPGNFLDSLYSGYETWILRDESGTLIGYFLLMPAVDEAHLLNITVHSDWHGQGVGRGLLSKVVELARNKGMRSVLLEVRPSNVRALAIYKRYGFTQIGVRKAYYPAAGGKREDAIVMRMPI